MNIKNLTLQNFLLLSFLTFTFASPLLAETRNELPPANQPPADRPLATQAVQQNESAQMKLDQDGTLARGEYEQISANGAVTRALCPYTCADRGLAKEHCRTWGSKASPDKCYVWDTTLPNDAVPAVK